MRSNHRRVPGTNLTRENLKFSKTLRTVMKPEVMVIQHLRYIDFRVNKIDQMFMRIHELLREYPPIYYN